MIVETLLGASAGDSLPALMMTGSEMIKEITDMTTKLTKSQMLDALVKEFEKTKSDYEECISGADVDVMAEAINRAALAQMHKVLAAMQIEEE